MEVAFKNIEFFHFLIKPVLLRKTNVTFSLICGPYILYRYIKSTIYIYISHIVICEIYGIIYVCEKPSREIKWD